MHPLVDVEIIESPSGWRQAQTAAIFTLMLAVTFANMERECFSKRQLPEDGQAGPKYVAIDVNWMWF